MLQILVDMVRNLSEEVTLLKSENLDMRRQIMDLKVPSDITPGPSTFVRSLPPAAKSYSEVAAACLPVQHSVSASVPDISTVPVKSTAGKNIDVAAPTASGDGFVTVVGKKEEGIVQERNSHRVEIGPLHGRADAPSSACDNQAC
ncbi:hypothetical protein L798_11363 [Zootermopsis nevadensis]|uniref:Uncharacterized protein n=1 Tax=Zootermopsis nevadensis TaxID=136037 RepID=A0A067RL94_ZOONE|nr:hypothetical protein L798_11363 [Zootermopsis nevadensis]